MKKRGRPAKNPDDPINNIITAKLSQEDIKKLDYCCEKLELKRSAVIRKGIDNVYAEIKE